MSKAHYSELVISILQEAEEWMKRNGLLPVCTDVSAINSRETLAGRTVLFGNSLTYVGESTWEYKDYQKNVIHTVASIGKYCEGWHRPDNISNSLLKDLLSPESVRWTLLWEGKKLLTYKRKQLLAEYLGKKFPEYDFSDYTTALKEAIKDYCSNMRTD